MRTPTFLPCKSFHFFCLPVSWRSGLCQSCSRLLGSRFLSPRLPPHQVGSIQLKRLIWNSVFTRRGFKTHYGPWSTGGDHQTHITAADLRAPYTTLGYDFHDQVWWQNIYKCVNFPFRTLPPLVQLGTTPPTSLWIGCPISSQSTSVLRRDSFSAAIQRAGFENIILFITLA